MADSLRYKSLPFAVQAVADDGTFTLYASVFGNLDRAGDVVVAGAFANLPEFVASGWGDVNHKHDDLGVATIDTAVQDAHGLKLSGRFHSTDDAQRLRTKIKERMERGKAVSCSIGYRVLEASSEFRNGQAITYLKKIELYEFSFVAVPANPEARVVDVKSGPRWIQPQDLVERVRAEVKVGRVLSTANRDRLARMCDQLRGAAEELTALLEATQPAAPEACDEDPAVDPEGDSNDDVPTAAAAKQHATLRRRSLAGRLMQRPA